MVPQLLIHPQPARREKETLKILDKNSLRRDHPNVLWFDVEDKLGVEQAKLIREHLGTKPYQGSSQVVVLISAQNLTPEAQNALLKTLEEPPDSAIIILGSPSEDQLLPTVISRCQVVSLESPKDQPQESSERIEKLPQENLEQRFQFIEKLDNKESFLRSLMQMYRQRTLENPTKKDLDFLRELIEAERWVNQNVNIRAILEYLMLKMPAE